MVTVAPRNTETTALLAVAMAALIASGLHPHDRLTWALEVAPIAIFFPIRLMFIHAMILILGARFTYERVLLGRWVRDAALLGKAHDRQLGEIPA